MKTTIQSLSIVFILFANHSAFSQKYKTPADSLKLKKDSTLVRYFLNDFERFGTLHEYYQPENGEPILNAGFQNWNYLVLNLTAWMENKKVIEEF